MIKLLVLLNAGIRACIDAMEHVEEEKYEIAVDVHGMRNGPRLGRLRALNMVIFLTSSPILITLSTTSS